MPHDEETEAKVFIPLTSGPNSFQNWFSKREGKKLGKYLDTALPVYEQSRFEDQIIYVRANPAGTGGAIVFLFNVVDIGSFEVLDIHIGAEATAPRQWVVNRFAAIDATSVDVITVARINVTEGQDMRMVGGQGSILRAFPDDTAFQFSSPPFKVYRGIKGFRDEGFNVIVTDSTLADPVFVSATVRKIPQPASYLGNNAGFTVT